jgi:hypothetical protein
MSKNLISLTNELFHCFSVQSLPTYAQQFILLHDFALGRHAEELNVKAFPGEGAGRLLLSATRPHLAWCCPPYV